MTRRAAAAQPRRALGIAAVAGVTLALVCGCGPKAASEATTADTRFPVEVATVEHRAITHRITAPGALEAFETVRVVARVSGVVERLLVSEGDHVEAGAPVAEIEPERYQLAVASAEASRDRAAASRDEALASLARRQQLQRGGGTLVTDEELAQFTARSAQASADVASAEAALARARLDLRDARVAAPAAGVIQARLADPGQYAQPGTPIATLVRRDPLRLRFSLPVEEARLLRVGQAVTFRPRGADADATATLAFIADQADPGTRLVAAIAIVERGAAGGALLPGAFAEVVAEAGAAEPAVVLPETAVRPSERGLLAFVVADEGGKAIARERTLVLGMRTADGSVVVRGGVEAGERVVSRGAEALRHGVEVRVVPAVKPEARPGDAGADGGGRR